jgi:hypothetical protein
MKRFLLKAAAFVGVHLAFIAVIVALYTRRYPPSESYYAAMLDKQRLLETRHSPRLIFVGGSSMALGMDSSRVAEPLGFNPINMGMNIAVGLEFMLDGVEPFLKRGDVVIVAPELHTFQTHYRANPECVARLIECHPSLLRSLHFRYYKSLLDAGYLAHLARVVRVMTGWSRSEGLWDGLANVYSHRNAFNENGDLVAHHGIRPSRGSPLRFVFNSPEIAERAISHLNEFHQHCRVRGVRVFYSHAPYERKAFDRYQSSIAPLENMLKAKLTIPMLDSGEEMTFGSDEIFDVEYHLNLAGKVRHSQIVADRLRKALSNQVREE